MLMQSQRVTGKLKVREVVLGEETKKIIEIVAVSTGAIYMDYLLTLMPKINYAYLNHPELLDTCLFWSEELPERCRLTQRNKKCLKK